MSQKRIPTMKVGLPIVLSCLILLGLVSCDKGTSGVKSKDVSYFANHSGLVIPPTAKATDHRLNFLRDDEELLRLEMPVGDLAEFLSKSGLDGELNNTTRPEPATSYLGDFMATHPKKFREGQKDLSGGEFLNVLVDEDSSTNTVVYLQWLGDTGL